MTDSLIPYGADKEIVARLNVAIDALRLVLIARGPGDAALEQAMLLLAERLRRFQGTP
jgi:hypothetical protein